jgi:hypothetical protein
MHDKAFRWTAGIAAAVILAAGGTLAGMTLAGSGSGASQANTAQATALNSTLGSVAGGCVKKSGVKASGDAAGGGAGIGGGAGAARHKGRKGCLSSRMRRIGGLYGEIAFHTASGTETLAFQRGLILSDRSGQLSVESKNGTVWTWDMGSSSVVRQSGKTAASSALKSGTRVFVGGQVAGSTRDAKLVVIRPAQSSKGSSSSSSSSGASPGSSSTSAYSSSTN